MLTEVQVVALIVATIGATTDIITTKIYNWLTFPAAILGVILNYINGGWTAALLAVAGWCLGVMIMVLPNIKKKKIWFGDAKLVAALGALLGPGTLMIVWGYFAVAWGGYATYRWCTVVPWKQFLGLLFMGGTGAKPQMSPEVMERMHETMQKPVPIGPSIAIGTVLGILLEKPTLRFMGWNV